MELKTLIYEPAGETGVAVICLHRPEARNALNAQVNRDLLEALDLVEGDEGARVLILTGDGGAFAAGADVSEMATATPWEAMATSGVGRLVNDRLESLPIPTVAAVNGYALGGGFELALACDFRVGGPQTVFGLPETGLGILPGAGGSQRLLALVGLGKARELVMLGAWVKGAQAAALGLCDRYDEGGDVLAAALALAEELKKKPKLALAAAKGALNTGAYRTLREGMERESAAFQLLFDTYDQKEGMRAMLEKRAPKFENR